MMTAFIRTLILYFFIMIGLRLMGKRQIGELEPSELVLTMMLSDLATVPMQDFGIPLSAGLLPILTLLALSMLLSQLSLRHLRLRAVICGTPALLIYKGKIQQYIMRENRYTIDELLEELRGQGYASIESVKYAVLENSGQLSVLPWTDQDQNPTTLPVILINDGRLLYQNLSASGHDMNWLQNELSKQNLTSYRDVFLFTLDEQGGIFCVPKENKKENKSKNTQKQKQKQDQNQKEENA